MKKGFFMQKIMLFLCLGLSFNLYAKRLLEVDVDITPAGDFTAINKSIKGNITQKNGMLYAEEIKAKMGRFKTGSALFKLRDKHLKKYIKAEQYPYALIKNASGKNGKGQATLSFMGQEKPISFTYKEQGKDFLGEFDLNIKEWGITGVNYNGAGVKDIVHVRVTLPRPKTGK